ncbi:ZP domain-containing protein-like [Haliotis rufescens]|uniref:ZP domain-containing protein-like n=1 Tax=Haliotis rufescens TaxID=6454 RepID=UPI00201F9F24|nr:ZP domain-containing protein-like [Haliotis rufescens]
MTHAEETVSVLLLLVSVIAQVDGAVQDNNVSLILGPDPHTGLVQITHAGRTGLVCDDGFDVHAAEIACRQAGYPTTNPRIEVAGKFHALPPSMTYILDEIKCFGNEATLSNCQHDPWFVEDCGSGETVAVFCQDNPCMSSPCRHNASCTEVTTLNFLCSCTSGYTGSLCESDIDECTLQNGGCSHSCVNDIGSYHCECPDVELDLSTDHHTCVATGESVSCTSQAMTITFDKGHFPGLHAQHVTLTDPTCRATSNGTHVMITAPLGACGTKSSNLGGKIMYENVVKSREEVIDGVISHVRDIEVPFQCIVPLSENLEVPLRVDRDVLTFSAEARGQFDTRLELFQDGTYQQAVSNSFLATPGEAMHAQIFVSSNGSDVTPFPVRCIATPTRNISYNVYDLIDKGCAIDTTLTFHSSNDDAKVQFSFEAFKYLDNSPAVFLHCDVTMCLTSDKTSRCSNNCSATHRSRRSLRYSSDKGDNQWPGSNGALPIVDESSLSQSTTVLTTGIVTSLLSLTFLLSVFVKHRYVKSSQKHVIYQPYSSVWT